ncbi:membrane protein [Sulfuriferula plumbiphila]|uniref:Membrane protein n=1 Tax=Sulfuriferula plumbiphila TaxID=171865 RepID=A0A512LCJ9_9PROT|nr:DoxX family protein [Sulfuriferula plumbiphila]BBP05388.1 membrane protein [Sulfuriferula plumbiphila]GEP32205.1 membrane protein [Sulfuriferula plumbiphila]
MTMTNKPIRIAKFAIQRLDDISPVIDLAARLFVANVFWKSGLTKIANWDSTVYLFTYLYHVPVLSPEVAATSATMVELGGAVLLALGLASRFGTAALFILNIVAATSYPDLSDAGRQLHVYWGIFLLIFLLHGPGKLSIDHFIRKKMMG